MLSARDKKLWHLYLIKLGEIGVTDIGPLHNIPDPDRYLSFLYQAKYGTTPVSVEYRPWTRKAPGIVVVCYAGAGRMIARLTTDCKMSAIQVQFYLLN